MFKWNEILKVTPPVKHVALYCPTENFITRNDKNVSSELLLRTEMSVACIAEPERNNFDLVVVCIPLTDNQGSLSEGYSMLKLFQRMRKMESEKVLCLICFHLNDSHAQFESTVALFFSLVMPRLGC